MLAQYRMRRSASIAETGKGNEQIRDPLLISIFSRRHTTHITQTGKLIWFTFFSF